MVMMFTQIHRWTVHLFHRQLEIYRAPQTTKEPGDVTGVGVTKCNNIILCYVHMATSSQNPFNLIACMYVYVCTHTPTTLTSTPSLAIPPTKKRRIQKKNKAEKALEKAMESFMTYQQAAEEIPETGQ